MQCYVANCYTCILYLLSYLSLSVISIAITVTTGVVLAMKPEVIAIGDPQDGRWKITLMFDGRRFGIPKFRYPTLQQTTVAIRQ